MNLFAFTAVAQGVVFKLVAKDGVSVVDYTVFRNTFTLIIAGSQSCYKRQNPFRNFPRHVIKDIITRSVFGQITFAIVNMSLVLIPIATTMVLF